MKVVREHSQTLQRVKVGMIGLAAVVLLIGLASAIIGSAVRAPSGGNAAGDSVANLSINIAESSEPLAQLGAAPAPINEQITAAR